MEKLLHKTHRVLQRIITRYKMKTTHFIIFVTLAAILSSATLAAQDYVPTPVTISKEKVKVDGKIFYSHIVLEKQTLYSICKAYGVTKEEVYEANPTLEETGLKKNAIILIPADRPLQKTGSDTTSAELQVALPGPKDTTVSRTTKKEEKQYRRKNKENQDDFITHTVRWYEDLNSISEKYGVPVDAIMRANSLTGRKLTNRQKLKIPIVQKTETQTMTTAEGADSTAAVPVQKEINQKALFSSYRQPKDKIEAILMLPFNAGSDKPSEGNLDFYCGALLAAKHLGDMGISLDLSVYDIADGSLHVTLDRLSRSDIVIGPVSSSGLGRLMEVCPESTAVVSPLDHRAEPLASSYSNFIQAPSSYHAQYGDLIQWIKEDKRHADPVIVIYEKGSRDTEETTELNNLLVSSGIPYVTFSYSILEGRKITDSLAELMKKDASNRVLIVSESEAFVNDVMRNLNLMIHSKYDIVLYGPSKIRSFETIEIDNLHNTNLHTSLSYYIDFDDPEVQEFIMQYRALYNTEPTPFSYQGYDTLFYFIKLISDYGDNWKDMLGKRTAMMQTDFMFTRTGDKGYVNSAVRRVIYGPGYSVILED